MLIRLALVLGEDGGGNAFLPRDLTPSEKAWFTAEAKRQDIPVFESMSRAGRKVSAIAGADAFFKLLRFERQVSNDKERFFCAALIARKLQQWHRDQNRDIEQPQPQTLERRMVQHDDKSFVQDGVRWFPLSAAAPVIQAPRSTLMHWINKETKFDGRPLQTYYFAPANRYFISEESIDRAANRFIKWPSQEPAGPVTLGEQRDQSGYVGLTDAARTLGVDHHTMWRWTTKGTAPTDKPLDVIKCPASDQFYIRQRDVAALKKIVPRSGLHAGRRAQPGPQPN